MALGLFPGFGHESVLARCQILGFWLLHLLQPLYSPVQKQHVVQIDQRVCLFSDVSCRASSQRVPQVLFGVDSGHPRRFGLELQVVDNDETVGGIAISRFGFAET